MDDRSYRTSTKKELIARLQGLQDIAVELLKEVDQYKLLELIVRKAMSLMSSDAGSLYLRNQKGGLTFEVCLNDSIEIDFEKTELHSRDHSLANYSFHNKKVLRIDDVYQIDEKQFKFNSSFDKKIGYRTKSVLLCPLISSQNEALGVIQLINRKHSHLDTWPSENEELIQRYSGFLAEDQQLLVSFAALATAALENSKLYKEIHSLLDGFVRASVDAIESRDVATSGHSERVAILTLDLAEKVSLSQDRGIRSLKFNEQQLKELKYASLLHDFGKIGVGENLLLKAKKLYPEQQYEIQTRIQEYSHMAEIRELRSLLERLAYEEGQISEIELASEFKKIKSLRQEIEHCWKEVQELNETTILDHDNTKKLEGLCERHFFDLEGEKKPLLNPHEIEFLSIKRGSLTDEERHMVNMHVSNTYKFLKKIPWTRELKNLPAIAHAHHEKLDGSGYPLGLKAPQIPIQSQLMTITDIFDALVAMDRPYKKSVPINRALEILEQEARAGKLEKKFLKVFFEAKVYKNSKFLELIQDPQKIKKAA